MQLTLCTSCKNSMHVFLSVVPEYTSSSKLSEMPCVYLTYMFWKELMNVIV